MLDQSIPALGRRMNCGTHNPAGRMVERAGRRHRGQPVAQNVLMSSQDTSVYLKALITYYRVQNDRKTITELDSLDVISSNIIQDHVQSLEKFLWFVRTPSIAPSEIAGADARHTHKIPAAQYAQHAVCTTPEPGWRVIRPAAYTVSLSSPV